MDAFMGWIVTGLSVGLVLGFWCVLKSRNIQIWFWSYLRSSLSGRRLNSGSRKQHIYFCLADHYEPYFGSASCEKAQELVKKWMDGYRRVASSHSDSQGKRPQHSYFYPVEEYDEWVLDQIQQICTDGFGDLDIHLHHDNDTPENLLTTLHDFKTLLQSRHGLLRKDLNGETVYGFIHGNWALDNSRPDGKWCGVDNEIEVLLNTGCVFDMTMPSAPSDTQTSMINSIYFAKESGGPKSHNTGRLAQVGDWGGKDELLMIQGPLTLNWNNRKFGLIPRIENGELSSDSPPSDSRIDLWQKCGVCVRGAEDHIFIKLYTHGLQQENLAMFFDSGGFDRLFDGLERKFRDNDNYVLHYVTAWEMYCQIKTLCTAADSSTNR